MLRYVNIIFVKYKYNNKGQDKYIIFYREPSKLRIGKSSIYLLSPFSSFFERY